MQIFSQKLLDLIFFFFLAIIFPGTVFAGSHLWNTGFINLLGQFNQFLNVIIGLIITLALLFFLWGMAVFILNAGSEDKRAEGKQKMIWGIIILTVMVGVWGIVNVLLIAFGIDSTGSVPSHPSFPPTLP